MSSSTSRLARAARSVGLSGPEWLGTIVCGVAFAAWNSAARGSFEPVALPFFLAASYVIALAGKLVLQVVLPAWPIADFPTTFVIGFFATSAPLYVTTLVSPLGIMPDALLLVCAILACGFALHAWNSGESPPENACPRPGLVATLLSLFAATFWSADAICPVVFDHGRVIFKPWSDCFLHACLVRMFRDSHGLGTLSNVMLPGRPAPLYHYASYSVPAVMAAVTGTPCYEALTSFLIPTGVFLAGLAAYTLVRSWWGPNAGVAATAALLLLPDASFYGVGNPYLSYHWLQQIAPAGTYGVALAAIAWLLVFEGCRTNRRRTVALGLVAGGMVVLYKAHIFVAIALPIWLAPALLLPGVKARWRAVWLVSAAAAFVGVASLAQFVPSAPTLRLDGSGMSQYVDELTFNLPAGAIREYLTVPSPHPPVQVFVKGAEHVLVGTLGACLLAYVVFAPVLMRRLSSDGPYRAAESTRTFRDRIAATLFPLVVIVNYLAMALGLATSPGQLTQPDELLHRPLVWAYFVTAAWVGGAFYQIALKDRFERSRHVRNLTYAALCGLLLVPVFLGKGIQVGPGWGKELTNTAMSAGFYRCALFLRENTPRGAVVQDSLLASDKALGAISERSEFVVEYPLARTRNLLADRLDAVRRLEQIVNVAELKRYASSLGLSWYVLRPGARVYWDVRFLAKPAYESGSYRVYALEGEGR